MGNSFQNITDADLSPHKLLSTEMGGIPPVQYNDPQQLDKYNRPYVSPNEYQVKQPNYALRGALTGAGILGGMSALKAMGNGFRKRKGFGRSVGMGMSKLGGAKALTGAVIGGGIGMMMNSRNKREQQQAIRMKQKEDARNRRHELLSRMIHNHGQVGLARQHAISNVARAQGPMYPSNQFQPFTPAYTPPAPNPYGGATAMDSLEYKQIINGV